MDDTKQRELLSEQFCVDWMCERRWGGNFLETKGDNSFDGMVALGTQDQTKGDSFGVVVSPGLQDETEGDHFIVETL